MMPIIEAKKALKGNNKLSAKSLMKKIIKLNHYYAIYFKHRIRYGKPHSFERKDSKLLIIGNGPSAGNINYEYYKQNGYELMCVNDFALKKDLFFRLKPQYYCCIDDAMYSSRNLKDNEDVIGVYDSINSITWEMTYVCRYGQEPPIKNPNIKIVRVNSSVFTDSFDSLQFWRYDNNKACTGFQNVICCCLYFAVASRFEKVLLTGVEFDMHKELSVEPNNDVVREYKHFYGTKKVNITEEGQIGKGEIYKYFYYSYLTLFQYKLLYEYSLYAKIDVKNLTLNSTIDSIPKIAPVNVI